MTSPHHDPAEEAAFEEFLEGRGELVKQLKALSQLTPSAALDAAILASAKNAVEQAKRARETAANDPVAAHKNGFLSRVRMPMAMAASLMVAVLVTVLWHAQPTDQLSLQASPAPVGEPLPAAAPTVEAPPVEQHAPQAKAAVEAPARNITAARTPMVEAHPLAEARAPASEKKAVPQIASNATVTHETAKLAEKPTDQKLPQLHADTAPMPSRQSGMQLQGRMAAAPAAGSVTTEAAKPAAVTPSAAPVAAPLAAPPAEPPAKAASQDKQAAWLARIEGLVKANSDKEAAAELEKFEKAYPAYPVPEKLKAQIQALKN